MNTKSESPSSRMASTRSRIEDGRRLRLRVLLAPILSVTAVVLLCVVAPKSSETGPSETAGIELVASRTPRLIASARIHASVGGVVRASNGVAIRIPPHVMKSDGLVTIKSLGGGRYNIHIHPAWKGRVTIRLPLADGQPIIEHRYPDGSWVLERAREVRGMAQARVASLSVFSNIGACFARLAAGDALGVARCIVKLGIKVLPEKLGRKIVESFLEYNPCAGFSVKDFTTGWVTILTTSCSVGDPTPPPPPTSPTPSLPNYGPPGTILISPCLDLHQAAGHDSPVIGCVPEGQQVLIQCVAYANAVTGPYGTSTIWDRTTFSNMVGFVADAWVYTGTNGPIAGNC